MATNWGITTILGSGVGVNFCRALPGTSPNVANMILKSISVYESTGSASDSIRVALYSGGTSDTNPSGASLIFGALLSGAGGAGWKVASAGDESIPQNTRIWVGLKGSSTDLGVQYSMDSGDRGDFKTDGRYESSVVSNDENTAWPNPWPADSGSSSTAWYSIYLTYDTSSGLSIPIVRNNHENQ